MDRIAQVELVKELHPTPPVISPNGRAVETWLRWRSSLAVALGSSAALSEIASTELHLARVRLARSDDPQAWLWGTICGAELACREARASRPARRAVA